MTIHHDKMAYGKLDSLSEKFSEDKLKKMAKLLSEEKDCAECGDKAENSEDKKEDKKEGGKQSPRK